MKIRSVRPEFFTDSKMANLSYGARLLYVGLWCLADDYGRGKLLPKQMEGQLFPMEQVPFAEWWTELKKTKRVATYVVDGEAYWVIPTFELYQKPNRKYDSKHPEPPEEPEETLFDFEQHTLHAVPEQREDTADAHVGEGVGVGEGAAADTSFQVFHSNRARIEVDRRAAAGIPIKNKTGLAITIAGDAEFVAESERIWGHRDCGECGGSGFLSVYAPGAGSKPVDCDGVT